MFAFDTGPGVAVIDAVARMVDQRRSYDRDGKIAAQRNRPRGTSLRASGRPVLCGRRRPRAPAVNGSATSTRAALHQRSPGADGVATAVELTARTVADAVARWTPAGVEVVASGGGCHHPGLMASLGRQLPQRGNHPLRRFDELFFPGDAKEAVAFALLGYLTLHGQPGNIPAATGAGGSRVLGAVTPP